MFLIGKINEIFLEFVYFHTRMIIVVHKKKRTKIQLLVNVICVQVPKNMRDLKKIKIFYKLFHILI